MHLMHTFMPSNQRKGLLHEQVTSWLAPGARAGRVSLCLGLGVPSRPVQERSPKTYTPRFTKCSPRRQSRNCKISNRRTQRLGNPVVAAQDRPLRFVK